MNNITNPITPKMNGPSKRNLVEFIKIYAPKAIEHIVKNKCTIFNFSL
jgi:hypothetical protein